MQVWKHLKFQWRTYWLRRTYLNVLDELAAPRYSYGCPKRYECSRNAVHNWYQTEWEKIRSDISGDM